MTLRRVSPNVLVKTKLEGLKACIKKHSFNLLILTTFGLKHWEEGEFPSGGLWGVCIETAATITSEFMNGNGFLGSQIRCQMLDIRC